MKNHVYKKMRRSKKKHPLAVPVLLSALAFVVYLCTLFPFTKPYAHICLKLNLESYESTIEYVDAGLSHEYQIGEKRYINPNTGILIPNDIYIEKGCSTKVYFRIYRGFLREAAVIYSSDNTKPTSSDFSSDLSNLPFPEYEKNATIGNHWFFVVSGL